MGRVPVVRRLRAAGARYAGVVDRDPLIDALSRSQEVVLISGDELVRRLAEVSHETWMRQKHRDQHVVLEAISPEVTDHDLERAEDAVTELERLGLYAPPGRQG